MACLLHNTTIFFVQYPGQPPHEVDEAQFIDVLIGMEFCPRYFEGVRVWSQTRERP